MKAVTSHQPWASLIGKGVKTRETRSWMPPENLRGKRIAIHAGKKLVTDVHPAIEKEMRYYYGKDWHKNIPLGAVVATATLADWKPTEGNELDVYGDYSQGRFYWILEDIKEILPPWETRGWQRIWNWNP